jgi:hypothetical protein
MGLLSAVQTAGTSRTSAEVLQWLGESVEVSRDRTAYTWAGLSDRLGLTITAGVRQLVNVLKQQGGEEQMLAAELFDDSLKSGGVNFASPTVQAALEQIRAGLDQAGQAQGVALVRALLSLGITYAPRYTLYGLRELPRLEEIEAAQRQAAQKARLVAWQNEILNPLLAAGGTVEEVLDAILSQTERWEG